MNIKCFFKNINNQPHCAIYHNGIEYYSGPVVPTIDITTSHCENTLLEILFTNKTPSDTIVNDSGEIISDKSFELERLIFDGFDIEEYIWESEYITNDNNIYPSCLFFGPPGKFTLKFRGDALAWVLRSRHEKYNNDPDWFEDYSYYMAAWKKLQQIQN